MPFPVFSESCFLSIKPVSKGPNGSNTERHCQGASNHNDVDVQSGLLGLKDIVKVHQITTDSFGVFDLRKLKDIVKVHQITTKGAEQIWAKD